MLYHRYGKPKNELLFHISIQSQARVSI